MFNIQFLCGGLFLHIVRGITARFVVAIIVGETIQKRFEILPFTACVSDFTIY